MSQNQKQPPPPPHISRENRIDISSTVESRSVTNVIEGNSVSRYPLLPGSSYQGQRFLQSRYTHGFRLCQNSKYFGNHLFRLLPLLVVGRYEICGYGNMDSSTSEHLTFWHGLYTPIRDRAIVGSLLIKERRSWLQGP